MKVLISYPIALLNEAARINLLMEKDFDVFHLRKPDWPKEQVKALLDRLDESVLKRTALHQYHDVALDYGIQRLHFTAEKRLSLSAQELQQLKGEDAIFSTSVHSVEEYLSLPDTFDYAFLSPVFDSISKSDYKAIEIDLSVKNPNVDVIALGGITSKNTAEALSKGFNGVAMLGSIWKQYDRPVVLSIAGLDPSGGAGLLADIKTIEQHHCVGFGVVSALTVQTEDEFLSVDWVSTDKIIEQVLPLVKQYSINSIKIGIMPSLEAIQKVVLWLKDNCPDTSIIWDPVLSASAGAKLIENLDQVVLEDILKNVLLITPNALEAKILTGATNESAGADKLSQLSNVLLKGGHRAEAKGTDVLIDLNGGSYAFLPSDLEVYDKHGTGCILSSAVACNYAAGQSLDDACENAKVYVEKVMASNNNLLAYHVG